MNNNLKITDKLAVQRTILASERTFLAYFRTFLVFLSTGLAIIRLEILRPIKIIGYFLICIAPILLIIGIIRFYLTKKRINSVGKE